MLRARTLTSISLLLCTLGATALAGDIQQERLLRHRQRSLDPQMRLPLSAERNSRQTMLAATDLLDTKVYSDFYAANFTQRYPDLAHFGDGSGVAVWEDQRNGDWDVFAQKFAIGGDPQGGNIDLLADPYFRNQRQPRIAVDGADHVAVVWAEEEDAAIYAAVYDKNLSLLSGPLRLDDASGGNAANLPAVAGFNGGGFIAVWEDARSGANIYGQLLTSGGSPSGSNFQVNEAVSASTRLSPAVATDAADNFAVAWEDTRDGEQDVLVKVFNSSAAAQSGDIRPADVAFESAYQFSAQVAYVSDGYFLVSWISDRNAEQGVYAQLLDASGSFNGTNYQFNSATEDVCWDLSLKNRSDGGVAACWANLSGLAMIEFGFLDADGSLASTGTAEDSAVAGERGTPVLCWSPSGGQALWTDQRALNQDIYFEKFDTTPAKSGINAMINDDVIGSQQLEPDVAATPSGQAAVVWRDQKNDAGDIYFQLTNFSGSAAGTPIKLNDDLYRATQQAPQVASGNNGGIMVVWEDSREISGQTGKSIVTQFMSFGGAKIGTNQIASSDPGGYPKSDPSVAATTDGYSLVAWMEENVASKSLHLQAFTTSGSKYGSNFEVEVPALSGDNYRPRVGVRSDFSGVVTWTSVIGTRRVQMFQRLTEPGSTAGAPQLIALDSSQTQVLAADLFVNPTSGDFYIAVADSQLSGIEIDLLHYQQDGTLTGGILPVATGLSANFGDLRLSGDPLDGLLASWTDLQSDVRRAFGRILSQSSNPQSDVMALGEGGALETDPATAMYAGQFFALWCDNRNAGSGFDLYAGSGLYDWSAVDDNQAALPRSFSLSQNYPNPFNPTTTIEYYLPHSGEVTIEVFNLLGERVVTLWRGAQQAGSHHLEWDGADRSGRQVGSGVYFYRLTTPTGVLTRKMMLLK